MKRFASGISDLAVGPTTSSLALRHGIAQPPPSNWNDDSDPIFILRSVTAASNLQSDFSAPTLLSSFSGIGITEQAAIIGFNRVPPDHNGGVGPNHIVSVLNHVMQIYDKAGNLLNTQTLEDLFGNLLGTTALPDDPNLFYDELSDRFIYVSFELAGLGPTVNTADDHIILNIAVSKTSDPTQGWNVAAIDAKTVIDGNNTWTDFPGVAIDNGAIYISANMFDFDVGADGVRDFRGNRLWIVDKGLGSGGLFDGGSASISVYDPVALATDLSGLGVSNGTLTPARFASDPGVDGVYLVSSDIPGAGTSEVLQVIHVSNPLGAPSFTAQTIQLGDVSQDNLSGLPPAGQPGTSRTLATGDTRIFNGGAVWFEGKLYATFSGAPKSGPDAGQATVHWVELDAAAPAALSLLQQGDIGGEDIAPGTHTFQSSLNVNKDGTLLVNFSASGPSVYPGAYYAIRASGDPAGAFGLSQTLEPGVDYYYRTRAGEGISAQTTNRWGDFTGTSVDPTDGTTFWFFNSFADTRGSPNAAGEDGRWRIVVGSARATINEFHFAAGDPAESFYGGLGSDGLRIVGAATSTGLVLSAAAEDQVSAVLSGAANASVGAYHIERISFEGGAGNDTLTASGSFSGMSFENGTLTGVGADGDDYFDTSGVPTALVDFFSGDAGNDTLIGGAGGDMLLGGHGNDVIAGNGLGDFIYGGAGNDALSGGAGSDKIFGGAGGDTIDGAAGSDTIDGGDGNDLISAQSGRDTITGGAGNDSIDAAAGDDTVDAGGNHDSVFGGRGYDFLVGNNGNDTIQGGDDNDTLIGGKGYDYLLGQDGHDLLQGGVLSDTLLGGNGRDTLDGGDDNDRLFGEAQHDLIFGGAGNDYIDAGAGNDTVDAGGQRDFVFAGSRDDSIDGGNGNDTLAGGTGADTLDGGAGYDILQGDDGDDVINGGASNDVIFGNAGNDTIIFELGGGVDTLRDFTAGAATEDVINLVGFGVAFDMFSKVIAAASDDGTNTTIDFGSGDMLILRHVTVAELSADDFIFG